MRKAVTCRSSNTVCVIRRYVSVTTGVWTTTGMRTMAGAPQSHELARGARPNVMAAIESSENPAIFFMVSSPRSGELKSAQRQQIAGRNVRAHRINEFGGQSRAVQIEKRKVV